MSKFVIINADDFGLSEGTNIGILKAHKKGVLTSTSIFTTLPSFTDSVRSLKKYPNLGTGIHLSLTWGRAVLARNQVPDLVNSNGYFYPSYARILFKSLNGKFLTQVEDEFSAQIERLLSAGINIDHINSQQHSHMIPKIFPIVAKLAKKYKISYIRVPNESFFIVPSWPEMALPFINLNFVKYSLMKVFCINKKGSGNFVGLMYTTVSAKKVIAHILKNIKGELTEILTHPAFFRISQKDRGFDYSKQNALDFMQSRSRLSELKALIDPDIINLVKRSGIRLTNYKSISRHLRT